MKIIKQIFEYFKNIKNFKEFKRMKKLKEMKYKIHSSIDYCFMYYDKESKLRDLQFQQNCKSNFTSCVMTASIIEELR